MDDIILTSVFKVRVCQKVRFLIGKWTIWGADGSGSWLGVWLAAERAKESWNQKILYAPVGGPKNASVLVGAPKKSFGSYVRKPFSKQMWRPETRGYAMMGSCDVVMMG